MFQILVGNIFSILATVCDLFAASRKNPRTMIWAQTISQGFLAFSALVLGGYSAVVQNIVSVFRNLTALGKKSSKTIEYALVLLGVALGIVFNNLGWIGYLPIVANFEYSVAVFRFKNNERLLKIAFAVCIVLYAAFNLAIFNYAGAISNVIVLITTLLSLCRKAQENNH